MFTLKVLGGVLALVLGIYLGLGRNRQTPEDIDLVLGKGRRRKAKQHFMWLNYMRPVKRASQRRAKPSRFKTAVSTKDEE